MTEKKITSCLNCSLLKRDRMRAGLAEDELPCDNYPAKLPVRKDIMEAYICDNHNPKIRTKRQPKIQPSEIQQIMPPGIQPSGMTIIPIQSREDFINFLRKYFGVR